MSFSSTNGYTPETLDTIISQFRVGINEQFGTSYTEASFLGTNFYKHFYILAQRVSQNEIKTSEIFVKLQEYFNEINAAILRPSVTPNGLIDAFGEADYLASVKPMIEAEAGELRVCVDVDELGEDYAANKLEICTILKDQTVAGVITQGTETETLTLTNTQEFDFSFNLPNRLIVALRLTITTSRNNQAFIKDPEDVKSQLLENIAARYNLGKDFEPEIYFTSADAPWAGDILLEYRIDDQASWTATITNYANLVDAGDDEITVGSVTFVASSSAVTPGDATFQAATSDEATAASLAAQINAHADTRELVRATVVDDAVTIQARAGGTDGNAIALTYSDEGSSTVGASVSGSGTLSGGAVGTFASDIYETNYNDLFVTLLENVTLIEV